MRRLTPLECTRLQGYPDGWVDIGDWTASYIKSAIPRSTRRSVIPSPFLSGTGFSAESRTSMTVLRRSAVFLTASEVSRFVMRSTTGKERRCGQVRLNHSVLLLQKSVSQMVIKHDIYTAVLPALRNADETYHQCRRKENYRVLALSEMLV